VTEKATRIARAYPDRVEVRGRDLAGGLMGHVSFTEYFHLLLTGREPTDDERFFLDVLLVSIAEHGLMPSNVAARMTLAADPGSLHGVKRPLGRGQAFNGGDAGPGQCPDLQRARRRRCAADVHRAGAADADAAAVLGAGQPEVVAQHPQQRRVRRPVETDRATVYLEFDHG